MRRLMLFRHAKAERPEPGERDIVRPLGALVILALAALGVSVRQYSKRTA